MRGARHRLHDDGPTVRVVFSADGDLLGEVRTPEGFTVHQIGADFVLGVALDALSVPSVVRYPLVWGAGG